MIETIYALAFDSVVFFLIGYGFGRYMEAKELDEERQARIDQAGKAERTYSQ